MNQDLNHIARKFLDFIYRCTGLPMIVCDETGRIIQSDDPKRVGTLHAGAQRIMRAECDEIFVTEEDVERDPRMKEGCNVLITCERERLGTFGIAGPVGLARPLARVAAAVVSSWLKDQRQQAALADAATRLVAGMKTVSARTGEVTAEASQVTTLMAQASREASVKVAQSEQIIKTVQEIAQKSRVLSINGSVEAARASEQGRGFGVIAKEMLSLAEDARSAARSITLVLGQVQQAIAQVQSSIERSAALTSNQTSAFAEIGAVVDVLQRAVLALTQGERTRSAATSRQALPRVVAPVRGT